MDARTDYRARDFRDRPLSGSLCVTCRARPARRDSFGDCSVCMAVYFNKCGRELNALPEDE